MTFNNPFLSSLPQCSQCSRFRCLVWVTTGLTSYLLDLLTLFQRGPRLLGSGLQDVADGGCHTWSTACSQRAVCHNRIGGGQSFSSAVARTLCNMFVLCIDDSDDDREVSRKRTVRQAASKAVSKQREILLGDGGSEDEEHEDQEEPYMDRKQQQLNLLMVPLVLFCFHIFSTWRAFRLFSKSSSL